MNGPRIINKNYLLIAAQITAERTTKVTNITPALERRKGFALDVNVELRINKPGMAISTMEC